MNYLLIGLRNLLRNRRRSVVTLLAIAFGYASIAVFAGYVHNVYAGLTRQAIQGELLGHLTIMKRGLQTEGKLKPEKYLFSKSDIDTVSGILRKYSHTVLITPRLSISGIISNGRASTIFIANGVVPADVRKIEGDFQRKLAGDLDENNATGVALAEDLAKILQLKLNGSAAVLVSTLQGQANALDVDVADIFNTGSAGTNDKFIYMPLALAQNLYDVDGSADRLIVLLDDKSRTEEARTLFLSQLKDAGFDAEIKTWQDLSAFYRQVKNIFDMIFSFIFAIVLIVVVMSVVNSMSMTVVERTREIGTLRALGLRRVGIIKLFAVESFLLVAIGCLIGFLLTVGARYGVNALGITYQPPSSSNKVALLVDFDWAKMALAFLMMSVLGSLAALLPSRRAAKQPIIASLGHV